jgi:AcrR family transcriptional regulator
MEDQEIKIFSTSVELFITYGVKSVTMDDVARELSISKKTLYKFVNNKNELVQKCVEFIFTQIHTSLEDVQSKSTNAIDELFGFDEQLTLVMRAQKPAIIMQLKKHHPETFSWLMNNRRTMVMKLTTKNLQKGIAQGFYRHDMNADFIAMIYYAQTMMFAQDDLMPDEICTNPAFVRENLIYHLRGIASAKGLEYLQQKLQNNETSL